MKRVEIEIKLTIGDKDGLPELNKMRARAMMYEIIDVINAGDDRVVPNSCLSIRHGLETSETMGWSMFAEDYGLSIENELGEMHTKWSEENYSDGSREWTNREEVEVKD